MINRIREIRKAKGLTLADLAAACDPPTTAQTIGRLETGMRTLSVNWMDRIGDALNVDPQVLVASDRQERARIVAELGAGEPQPLAIPREAVLPTEMAGRHAPDGEEHCEEGGGQGSGAMMVIEVTAPVGEYRVGDTVWLRRIEPGDAGSAINRDCLVPRPGGRFAFGRLIDRRGSLIGILPPQSGQKQQVIDNPPWIAVATMLVRAL